MKTVTVSVRLPASEAERLERAAQGMGVERSTLLRLALRHGAQALLLERACDAYRRGELTLSRAVEMADLNVREMILKLRDQGVTLSYGPDELSVDLQSP